MNRKSKHIILMALAGASAGVVTGLFGAGGGMILVPFLSRIVKLKDSEIFPSSVAIILPMCAASLFLNANIAPVSSKEAFPYLVGSAAGGVAAGFIGKCIPTSWLHKILGLFIIWGGIRYLW